MILENVRVMDTSRLHLHMFDNTNVTTQTGSGQDMSAEMKTYYSKYLIKNAKAELSKALLFSYTRQMVFYPCRAGCPHPAAEKPC